MVCQRVNQMWLWNCGQCCWQSNDGAGNQTRKEATRWRDETVCTDTSPYRCGGDWDESTMNNEVVGWRVADEMWESGSFTGSWCAGDK
mmetsp:Transcript_11690/g.34367  ORF Transcript_11690/g.34367 Transcript_11690/m.34367 type:complete len:88 (-) Transcript_11690:8-271(-)